MINNGIWRRMENLFENSETYVEFVRLRLPAFLGVLFMDSALLTFLVVLFATLDCRQTRVKKLIKKRHLR